MPVKKVNKFIQAKVKIIKFKKLTDDVCEITLTKPEGIDHQPGQFVGIRIDDDPTKPAFRSYSLLSDEEGNLQLVIKVVEGGRGSTYLFNQKEGDELSVFYPLGYFGFPQKLNQHLIMMATGTGIVPILCMLESFPYNSDYEVDLFFGIRYIRDIFYQDRIKALEKKFKKFNYTMTLTKPESEWDGNTGRITDYLKVDKKAQYFMCGSGAMIEQVRNTLKQDKVNQKNIFYEDFNE